MRLMIWVRKGFVHLLAVVLFVALLGGVAALSLNRVFGQPAHLKAILNDSGVYDQVTSALLKQSQTNADQSGSDSSVSFDNPVVQKSAQQNLTPDLLKQSANTFIDANYAWLQGKTATPQFNIDLSGAKNSFAKQVGGAVTDHLKSLAVCTPPQLASLQLPVDPLTINCRPSTIDPATEGARVTDDINSSTNFINQPVITPDSLSQNTKQSQSKPYYQSLARLPHIYRLVQKLPLILGALSLLTALGIIFIAPAKRKGWRRVGVVLALAGLVLIIAKFVADAAVTKVADKLHSGPANQLKQPTTNVARHIEAQLFGFNLWFGAAFLALAIIIFIWLRKTRGGAGKPLKTDKTPAAGNDNNLSGDPVVDDLAIDSTPGMDVAGPPPRATTAPLVKPPIKASDEAPKIKKPKRPRLIQ